MPIIPMKQTIMVHRGSGTDEWGYALTPTTKSYKCRVDEKREVIDLAGNALGEESVSKATIYLDKLADIRYDDVVEYTNELNVSIKRKPLKIEVKRGINGKPILTVVYV
jgi:hypothetical protein